MNTTNEFSGLLARFLGENVCDSKTSTGFVYPSEIDWILMAFGAQANFGWDEDGLFAARLAIEPLVRKLRNIRLVKGAIDQALSDITCRMSSCETNFVLDFLRKLNTMIEAGKVEMETGGVDPRHVIDMVARRRFFLHAVLAILARYRCEPFIRNLRPAEDEPGDDEDSNVIEFQPSDGADQDGDDEDLDDDLRPNPSFCKIIEFPTYFCIR